MKPRTSYVIESKQARRALMEHGWNVAAAVDRLLDTDVFRSRSDDPAWQHQTRAQVYGIVNAVAAEFRNAQKKRRQKRSNRRRAA